MKELSSSCTHRPFYEQKMRLTSFFTHIGCVWPEIWYQISLAMINASCCSKNLGPLLPKDPIWGYSKKACPSGASIGWQVYPQNKHNFGFLVQTTIYRCCNAVQGMQQDPYSPQKNPLNSSHESALWSYHPWSWNNPQFTTFDLYRNDLFYKRSFAFIELWLELPSLEKIGRIISNFHWLCPYGDKFILNSSK